MQLNSLTLAGAALLLSSTAAAQSPSFHFSIDWQSASMGKLLPAGVSMVDGDIYRPTTPGAGPAPGVVPPPTVAAAHASDLGLPVGCSGRGPGVPCAVEVDAYSQGQDFRFGPNQVITPGDLIFSVDEFAAGLPGGPAPNVHSEFVAHDSAADTFGNLGSLPPGPFMPRYGRNIGMVDGDGAFSTSGYTYPAIGLVEPTSPVPGPIDSGDNQDAMDVIEPGTPTGAQHYFSLDGGRFDAREMLPNSNAAAGAGQLPGDILVGAAGSMAVWAPASALGLDRSTPGADDLDALILWENGNGVADIGNFPYSWDTGSDMIVFSVRRGSDVIGKPDSLFGLPIEEGDLLIPPVVGGLSANPGIFIPGESLGLLTVRTHGVLMGDDLDAADHLEGDLMDCDVDGVEDAIAIAMGITPDVDRNGVPDGCGTSPVGIPFCFCPATVAPCGNASASTGCLNGASLGAMLSGSGSASVTANDLVLTTTGMSHMYFCHTIMGTGALPPAACYNGIRCVGGAIHHFPMVYMGASGTSSIGLGHSMVSMGIPAHAAAAFPASGVITSGTTMYFQTFYRDLSGPCGAPFNLSNALAVTFTP